LRASLLTTNKLKAIQKHAEQELKTALSKKIDSLKLGLDLGVYMVVQTTLLHRPLAVAVRTPFSLRNLDGGEVKYHFRVIR